MGQCGASGFSSCRRRRVLAAARQPRRGRSGAACARLAGKNQDRVHHNDVKATRRERPIDAAQQSYQCVIEIVISSSSNEARMAHPKTILRSSVSELMITGSASGQNPERLRASIGRRPGDRERAGRDRDAAYRVVGALLQNVPDSFTSHTSSLEPGRICMITSYSYIASSRTQPVPDARVAL